MLLILFYIISLKYPYSHSQVTITSIHSLCDCTLRNYIIEYTKRKAFHVCRQTLSKFNSLIKVAFTNPYPFDSRRAQKVVAVRQNVSKLFPFFSFFEYQATNAPNTFVNENK